MNIPDIYRTELEQIEKQGKYIVPIVHINVKANAYDRINLIWTNRGIKTSCVLIFLREPREEVIVTCRFRFWSVGDVSRCHLVVPWWVKEYILGHIHT